MACPVGMSILQSQEREPFDSLASYSPESGIWVPEGLVAAATKPELLCFFSTVNMSQLFFNVKMFSHEHRAALLHLISPCNQKPGSQESSHLIPRGETHSSARQLPWHSHPSTQQQRVILAVAT